MDILAQQVVVASTAGHRTSGAEDELFALSETGMALSKPEQRKELGQVLHVLSEGFATSRGRRGAFLHHDEVNHRRSAHAEAHDSPPSRTAEPFRTTSTTRCALSLRACV